MTLPAEPQRPRSRDAGFTLIEVIVVVAILAFALVLFVGYKPPWSRGFDAHATAGELAGQLRLARSEAIAGNRAVAFELDLRGHSYRTGGAPPRPIPAALSLQLLTVAGARESAATGFIAFNPDGSSSGGRIVLADGSRRVAVGVDWLTGRVSIADAR